jgi:hypothetical protein
MTVTLRLCFTIPVLAALVSGCSPSFEADVPDIEITQRGLKIPGVPQTPPVGDVSVTSSFALSSCNTAWARKMNSDILVHQVRIVASGSLPDLDFVDLARVTAANPASPESPTELLSYDRSEVAPSSSDIDVSMSAPIDITALWSTDQAVIELQVAGQLPEQDWTVDLTLRLSGKMAYDF